MVYVLAFIGILAYVVQVTPSSLMATSGVFAIIFAVLSKVDVTNIIAGLGLSFSKVFKLGDWVKIADNEGEIIEMSVRGIKLLTVNNAIVNITNSTVSNSIIKNMGENPFRCKIHLEVVPRNYRYIEDALLEGVHKVVGLSEINKPFIAFLGQGDSAQIFEVYFYINDVSQKGDMINKVWREIWSATEKYNIQMSTPQREHFNFNMDKGD
jgi:branched-chain amino acid transport system substrate-binding protein